MPQYSVSHTISFSQVSMYKACKLKHYYYAIRRIEPKKVRPALTLGSCGHSLLEAFYRKKDIEVAKEIWVKKMIDSADWFDEDIEHIKKLANEAKNAVEYYIYCHPEDKDFVILDIEKFFKVPIQGTSIKVIGYLDLIAKENIDSKNVWILEHKFPRTSLRSEADLDLNQQLHMYEWAVKKMPEYKPYRIIGCLYNQILSKPPRIPPLNKNGTMSRAAISTTWEIYSAELRKHKLDPMEYLDMQQKLENNEFHRRTKVITPDVETNNFVHDLQRVAWEMTKKVSHIYGAYDFTCKSCDFREICIEHLKGGDIEFIIENSFRPRKDHREANKKVESIEE